MCIMWPLCLCMQSCYNVAKLDSLLYDLHPWFVVLFQCTRVVHQCAARRSHDHALNQLHLIMGKCKCGMDKESSIRAFSLRRNEVFVPSFLRETVLRCGSAWRFLFNFLLIIMTRYNSFSPSVYPGKHIAGCAPGPAHRSNERCFLEAWYWNLRNEKTSTVCTGETLLNSLRPRDKGINSAERRYAHCFMPGIHDAREEENRRKVSYLFHSVSVCVHLEEWALFGCARSSRSQDASK